MNKLYCNQVVSTILNETIDSVLDAKFVAHEILNQMVEAESLEKKSKQQQQQQQMETLINTPKPKEDCTEVTSSVGKVNLLSEMTSSDGLRVKTKPAITSSDGLKVKLRPEITPQEGLKVKLRTEKASSEGIKIKLQLSPQKKLNEASPVKSNKPDQPLQQSQQQQQPIKIRIPKSVVSPKILEKSLVEPLRVPAVKIKPIHKPSTDTKDAGTPIVSKGKLAVAPTDKKLKIRITKNPAKLRIRLSGRKAARIVKNSKLLKKKLEKKRLREKTRFSSRNVKAAPPQPPKVSLVTVLKMSEIVSMKPTRPNLPSTPNLESPTVKILERCTPKPDVLEKTKVDPRQIVGAAGKPSVRLTGPSLALKTPDKSIPSSIPELEDEFTSLDSCSSLSSKKMTVNDPKVSKKQLAATKVKTLVSGIKQIKQRKSKKTAKPTHALQPGLEKKRSTVELIMAKIAPAMVDPVPSVPVSTVKRRCSSGQAKEGWLTTQQVAPVARKSRPEETVSFSLPQGGFKGEDNCQPVPWYAR